MSSWDERDSLVRSDVEKMFQGTNCAIKRSPNLTADPPGPLCQTCGPTESPTSSPAPTITGRPTNTIPPTGEPTYEVTFSQTLMEDFEKTHFPTVV